MCKENMKCSVNITYISILVSISSKDMSEQRRYHRLLKLTQPLEKFQILLPLWESMVRFLNVLF